MLILIPSPPARRFLIAGTRLLPSLALLAGCLFAFCAPAAEVNVRHPQGWAHGFVEVTTLEGQRIGVGDLIQRVSRGRVTSRLVLNFSDGSVDDETTVYTQDQIFRLLSDHHIQRGPSFPTPVDVTIITRQNLVQTRDQAGRLSEAHIEMPPDTYNGMASTILMNLDADASDSTISIVVGGEKPRIAHLKSTRSGSIRFVLGGTRREGVEWTVHVDLGGVAKVVAPLIGKQPPDFHVRITGGDDPAFLREEGPLFEGGPVWRVQQITASFPE